MSLISKDYFDWMYKLVYGDKKYSKVRGRGSCKEVPRGGKI